MAPVKAKRHNTRSVTGAVGAKLTVNLKNNLVKTKTTKGVTNKQTNNKVSKVSKSVKKTAPTPTVTAAQNGGDRALQAGLLQAPGFMSALEQMYNLYTHNPTGQAQNLTLQMQKSFDCSMQNQNLLSKIPTKMAASQESNLVTVSRDGLMGDLSNRHGASNRCNQDLVVDGNQVLPPDDVEQHNVGMDVDMNIDEEDVPLSPTLGRPADLVLAASAPQSALQLCLCRTCQVRGTHLF